MASHLASLWKKALGRIENGLFHHFQLIYLLLTPLLCFFCFLFVVFFFIFALFQRTCLRGALPGELSVYEANFSFIPSCTLILEMSPFALSWAVFKDDIRQIVVA